MNIFKSQIAGVQVLKGDVSYDHRGAIGTLYRNNGPFYNTGFCEDKFSVSTEYVLRGFHGDFYTDKLLSCLWGNIQLAWVDLRKDSETYGKAETLRNIGRECQVFIPRGVANAHLCRGANCVFHYKQSYYYSGPENQITIRYDSVGIDWNLQKLPILSQRDSEAQTLSEYMNAN